jgi:hypothetical protein
MPQRPLTLTEAQQWAGDISRLFGNYECTDCAAAIVKAIGPCPGAEIVRLSTMDGSGVVGLRAEDKRISVTGIHVGVRVGDLVFDNHPAGVAATDWRSRFVAGTETDLVIASRPVVEFFGQIFRRKAFDYFVAGAAERG